MDFESFQDIIMKIQGVTHAKVVYDGEELQEIHVIANTIRSPKQIVRDIESVLLAMFSYKVDRKIISIAQIDNGETKSIKRILYAGLSLVIIDNNVECEVKLKMDDKEYSCKKSAISTSINRQKVIAKATVGAVEEIFGQAVVLDLEDIIISKTRDISFITVIINMINNALEEKLIGTAIVRNDLNETIARATLDALNRKIEK